MSTLTATPSPVAHPTLSGRAWKIALAIALAGGAAAGVYAWAHGRSPGKPAPAFRFETAEVSRGPIRAKVTATGTVNPTVTVQVGAQVSGTIRALGADFNSVVEPGQMMAQIDPRLFQAAVTRPRPTSSRPRPTCCRFRPSWPTPAGRPSATASSSTRT